MFALLFVPGCYLSHPASGPAGDGGAIDARRSEDARAVDDGRAVEDGRAVDSGLPPGPACVFSFEDRRTAGIIECRIELDSTRGCVDAARCICAAWTAGGGVEELDACVASELTPRGMITFTDFCTDAPPARMTMAEAIEGYLGYRHGSAVRISTECGLVPALITY